MDPRIDPVGPNPLPAGVPVSGVHGRTKEEREAFQEALAEEQRRKQQKEEEESADGPPAKPAPEMGDREPDEAGGRLDLLG